MALVAIALGLLGLAGLHCKAQQAEMESYQRTQALLLLEDMTHRLRANRIGKESYILADLGFSYVGQGSNFTGSGCDNAQACADLLEWQQALLGAAELDSGGSRVGGLIGARGCITGGGNDFVVTVAWQSMTVDNQGLDSLPAGDPRRTNACGQGLYGSEAQRRIVSGTVRFFVAF